MKLEVIPIFLRWVHVIAACGVIGASFFFYFLLPLGLKELEAPARQRILARCQRGFKMTVHVSLLLFLVSGTYNTLRNWPIYTSKPGLMHGLFGMHLLLGLGGIALLMVMTAGKQLKPARSGTARLALGLLLVAVAVASTLKSARESARESMLLHPAVTSSTASR